MHSEAGAGAVPERSSAFTPRVPFCLCREWGVSGESGG